MSPPPGMQTMRPGREFGAEGADQHQEARNQYDFEGSYDQGQQDDQGQHADQQQAGAFYQLQPPHRTHLDFLIVIDHCSANTGEQLTCRVPGVYFI